MLFRPAFLGGILLLGALAGPALACGDKFLVPGRAPTRPAYLATYPASILIYDVPGSPGMTRVLDPAVQRELARAGHRVEVCRKREECAAAARIGRVDVILADLREASSLQAAGGQAGRAVVVPVVYEAKGRAQAGGVRNVYDASKRSTDLIKVIDRALASRR